MEMLIKRPNNEDEFYTDEKCYILEVLNEKDDRSQSIARATVKPGVSTTLHKLLNTSEIYFILSGKALVTIDFTEKQEVLPGDVVRIPPGKAQSISNHGHEDLVFLCFCIPAFDPINYVEMS